MRIFFGDHADPESQAAQEWGDDAPIIAGGQVQAQEQPEDHQVIQQHLALVVDGQGGQVEEKGGHEGGDEAAGEATGDVEEQEDADQVHQQHQHAPGVDGVAEGLELVGQHADPGSDDQPAGRGMVIIIGVGGQAGLAQHGPGLLHVDALIGDVEGVEEQVVAMGEGPGEQAEQQQEAFEPDRAGASTGCGLLRTPCILASRPQPTLVSASGVMDDSRFIWNDAHLFLRVWATRSLQAAQPACERRYAGSSPSY